MAQGVREARPREVRVRPAAGGTPLGEGQWQETQAAPQAPEQLPPAAQAGVAQVRRQTAVPIPQAARESTCATRQKIWVPRCAACSSTANHQSMVSTAPARWGSRNTISPPTVASLPYF